MFQVFSNIIDNAVKHGDPFTINIYSHKNVAGGITISICNEGRYINRTTLEKIWSKGYSTKHKHSGLGLGIVKRIVEAHGWAITVKSKRGKTCFCIIIQ